MAYDPTKAMQDSLTKQNNDATLEDTNIGSTRNAGREGVQDVVAGRKPLAKGRGSMFSSDYSNNQTAQTPVDRGSSKPTL